jgi:hypothetical protein
MAEKRDDDYEDEQVIETEEGTAGGPQTHDPTGVILRAETPGMLPPKELDKRQKRIRTRRRKGGPNLAKGEPRGRGAQGDDQSADIPPTETEEPPGPPPPPSP